MAIGASGVVRCAAYTRRWATRRGSSTVSRRCRVCPLDWRCLIHIPFSATALTARFARGEAGVPGTCTLHRRSHASRRQEDPDLLRGRHRRAATTPPEGRASNCPQGNTALCAQLRPGYYSSGRPDSASVVLSCQGLSFRVCARYAHWQNRGPSCAHFMVLVCSAPPMLLVPTGPACLPATRSVSAYSQSHMPAGHLRPPAGLPAEQHCPLWSSGCRWD